MVRRVSLKGKGAEIFFGDNPATPQADAPAPAAPSGLPDVTSTASDDHSPSSVRTARLQASKQASKRASQPADKNASTQERKPDGDAVVALADILPAIFEQVAGRATISATFRYTDSELTRLTDALYDVTKRHRVKLTKQDVARLGLNAVLWDHETRRNQSLLTQLALRKKHEPGGES
jgi:hypothetical protein